MEFIEARSDRESTKKIRKIPNTSESLSIEAEISPRYIRPKSHRSINFPPNILSDAHRFKPCSIKYHSIRSYLEDIDRSEKYAYDPLTGLFLRALPHPQIWLEIE